MHVLVVYAHPNPGSFTHAVLEQVTRGLDESPHTYTVDDLYASGFDPVFSQADALQFLHESLPEEVLEAADPQAAVLEAAKGPIRRRPARRWLRGKSKREIAAALWERRPKDVQAQQALVAEATAGAVTWKVESRCSRRKRPSSSPPPSSPRRSTTRAGARLARGWRERSSWCESLVLNAGACRELI